MKSCRLWKNIVMFCAALVICADYCGAAEKITVAGSSTIRPIVQKAANIFKKSHPDVRFIIGGGGSSHGVKSAGNGDVSIGMASRNLYDKEKERFKDLRPHKIGLDGIAIITNSKNPVSEVTREQIREIYTGKITNWKDMGGEDKPILLRSMEEGRSTLDLFLDYFGLESKMIGKGRAAIMVHRAKGTGEYANAGARPVGPNLEALASVSIKTNVIAYVSVGTAQEVAGKGGRVKLLTLDGVEATVDNVAAEVYPWRRPLQVITKGNPEGVVGEFIKFLTSDKGREIVASFEFIPLKKDN